MGEWKYEMNIVTQLQSTGDETKVDCRSEIYMANNLFCTYSDFQQKTE